MTVTMKQVRAYLDPDETKYAQATTLGPAALPHLSVLAQGTDVGLSAKAVYLAGLIGTNDGYAIVHQASNNTCVNLQAAAGGVAGRLPIQEGNAVALSLLNKADPSIQKLALRAVRAPAPEPLANAIIALMNTSSHGRIRELCEQTLMRVTADPISPDQNQCGLFNDKHSRKMVP